MGQKLSLLLEELLQQNPYLLELMQQGLINLTALADKIKQSLKNSAGFDYSTPAISMALRRIVADQARTKSLRKSFPRYIEMSTKTNIYEVAIKNSKTGQRMAQKVRTSFMQNNGELLTVAEGSYEILFFTNQTNKSWMRKLLKGSTITSEKEQLAYITVNWPASTKNIPGIYYRITRALALRDISIQSFHTMGSEMMVFMQQSELVSAQEVLTRVLNNENLI